MNKEEYEIMYVTERDHWWYQGLRDLVEQATSRYIAGIKDVKILDAGCGTGGMLLRLAQFGEVAGMDYADEAITFCRKNDLENVCQQDLNNWHPPLSVYDVVISLDVLYHAAIVDDRHVVHQFQKALKPGGVLILNLPAFPVLFRNHDLAVHTRRRYRRKALETMLRDAGFSIVDSTYRLPLNFVLLLGKKVFERVVSGPRQQSDLTPLPSWVSATFAFLHRLENRCILSGMRMPFGSSVFVVARKES